MTARPGVSAADWRSAKTFSGHVAAPSDVEQADAVFALGDTFNGRVLEMAKPQPVIWYGEDEEFAALVVQAEVHETEEGETLEVLGLLLPNGDTAVAFLEDVEQVDDADPVWLSLLEADQDDEDGAEWADWNDEDDEVS